MTKELKFGIVMIIIIVSIFFIMPYIFENIGPIWSFIYGILCLLGIAQLYGLIRLKKININDDKNI